MTIKQIADKLGRSKSWVREQIKELGVVTYENGNRLELPEEVCDILRERIEQKREMRGENAHENAQRSAFQSGEKCEKCDLKVKLEELRAECDRLRAKNEEYADKYIGLVERTQALQLQTQAFTQALLSAPKARGGLFSRIFGRKQDPATPATPEEATDE